MSITVITDDFLEEVHTVFAYFYRNHIASNPPVFILKRSEISFGIYYSHSILTAS